VRVALAGIRLHLFVAATCAWVMVLGPAPGTSLHQLFSLLLVADASMALINAIPLVKFDGYVALVGWTDIPHLRTKAMRLAGDALGRIVFGRGTRSAPPAELQGVRWIAFGIASAVFAPVLVAVAISDYGPVFPALFGRTGAVAVLTLLALLLLIPTRGVVHAFRRAAARGVTAPRRAVGLLLLVACISAILNTVRVPVEDFGQFAADGGSVYVTYPAGAVPPTGTIVALRSPGILLNRTVANGVVCGAPTQRRIDVHAGSPVSAGTTPPRLVERSVVEVCSNVPTPDEGSAAISRGWVSLASWCSSAFVAPYWSLL
jgi:putative peptide zinc metalloprotease protein